MRGNTRRAPRRSGDDVNIGRNGANGSLAHRMDAMQVVGTAPGAPRSSGGGGGGNLSLPPAPVGNGHARNSDGYPHQPSSSRSQSDDSLINGQGSGRSSEGGPPPLAQAFHACVKVFCTSVAPCYALPWVRGEESHSTGSGFAALLPSGERRILVHASVLENHTLVQVRRVIDAQKYVAVVECVGYDVDVGVLHVADESFWSHMPLLQLPMGLPQPMSEVVTAGFGGGEELSTTRGVVNRILLGGSTRELCVQMDATINQHWSGGPVFNSSGQVVGMAAAGSSGAGYIIPLTVIHTFLDNLRMFIEAGHPYLGKSVDHYRVQPLENPELRVHLGLPARPAAGEEGGVLLSKLGPDAACAGVLEDGDVLLAVDGVPIAADGTVVLPEAPSVRVGMRYCVQRVALGQPIEYQVQRAGERLALQVCATTRKPRLLPPRHPVPRPEWLVLGGLVFTPLLPDYEGLVPKSMLQTIHGPPTPQCQQVVMLLRVLQSEVNIGYEEVCGMLESFNGVNVTSLAHLATLAEGAQLEAAPQLEFILVTGELLVLDGPRCWETEDEIFATHTIPARCSFDPSNPPLTQADVYPPPKG